MTTIPERPTFVLTVRQPWAWAIIYGGKTIENRTWKPRRPTEVLIHAGVIFEQHGLAALRRMRKDGLISRPVPRTFASGQIIGKVDVTGWDDDDSTDPWAVPDHWHWHLSNPVAAWPAIPVTGQPTFWRPPAGWQDSFPRSEDA